MFLENTDVGILYSFISNSKYGNLNLTVQLITTVSTIQFGWLLAWKLYNYATWECILLLFTTKPFYVVKPVHLFETGVQYVHRLLHSIFSILLLSIFSSHVIRSNRFAEISLLNMSRTATPKSPLAKSCSVLSSICSTLEGLKGE